jgi:hypothetical protein
VRECGSECGRERERERERVRDLIEFRLGADVLKLKRVRQRVGK